MPDRLPGQLMRKDAPEELTPKERLEQVAAILAWGVRRYVRNSLTDLTHLRVPFGPEKPPEFSPQGLELSENPRLTVSRSR